MNSFWEARFVPADPLSSVMLRGNSEDNVAAKRNRHELELLSSLLGLSGKADILDIGCGLGRMYLNFENEIRNYDGIDFSQNYVNFTNERYGSDKVRFHRMSAENIDTSVLLDSYDIIIVNGLCVYLNDDGVSALLDTVDRLSTEETKLYFRESVSTMDKRLTLKDFKSDELNADYNAIYRTTAEYNDVLAETLNGFNTLKSDLLLDEELGARDETNQRYWFMVKESK